MSCLYPLYPTVFSLCTTHRNAGMRNMSAMTLWSCRPWQRPSPLAKPPSLSCLHSSSCFLKSFVIPVSYPCLFSAIPIGRQDLFGLCFLEQRIIFVFSVQRYIFGNKQEQYSINLLFFCLCSFPQKFSHSCVFSYKNSYLCRPNGNNVPLRCNGRRLLTPVVNSSKYG